MRVEDQYESDFEGEHELERKNRPEMKSDPLELERAQIAGIQAESNQSSNAKADESKTETASDKEEFIEITDEKREIDEALAKLIGANVVKSGKRLDNKNITELSENEAIFSQQSIKQQ